MKTTPARFEMSLTTRKAMALELRPASNPDQVEPSRSLGFRGRTFKQAVNRVRVAGLNPAEWDVRFVYFS